MSNESQAPLEETKWWFDEDFEFYFGAMFECGDYEKLLDKIDSILAEHKKRIREEIERCKDGEDKDSVFYACQECGGHDAAIDKILNIESLKE